MITSTQSEVKELKKIQSVLDKLMISNTVELVLLYPALKRRNDSKNVTLCGGSYNPFHIGHEELLKKTLEFVDGSEAISYITLNHSLGKVVSGASFAERLYMLRLEQQRLPFMSVGVINDGFYRNWFHKLKKFHPSEELNYFCVMGADLFPRVIEGNNESDYPKIFSIPWLVAKRGGKAYDDFLIPKSVNPYLNMISSVPLPENVKDVSSSGLKNILKDRDSKVLDYILKDVFKFISRRNLYQ
ncbi:nicotinate-nucleotide adenylyltransferase [Candidatus Tiddalikarchaeum anstoanum]|nr:nicotinate-nucleotide adenylyltransferase [Candidatus Tiddalikarchaeum anstoanum]